MKIINDKELSDLDGGFTTVCRPGGDKFLELPVAAAVLEGKTIGAKKLFCGPNGL